MAANQATHSLCSLVTGLLGSLVLSAALGGCESDCGYDVGEIAKVEIARAFLLSRSYDQLARGSSMDRDIEERLRAKGISEDEFREVIRNSVYRSNASQCPRPKHYAVIGGEPGDVHYKTAAFQGIIVRGENKFNFGVAVIVNKCGKPIGFDDNGPRVDWEPMYDAKSAPPGTSCILLY